jgi:hypothetical protein
MLYSLTRLQVVRNMALLRKNEYKKDEDALNRAEAEQANALNYWGLHMNRAN